MARLPSQAENCGGVVVSTFPSSYVVVAGTNVSLTRIEEPAADKREPGDDIDLIEKEQDDDDENVIPKWSRHKRSIRTFKTFILFAAFEVRFFYYFQQPIVMPIVLCLWFRQSCCTHRPLW